MEFIIFWFIFAIIGACVAGSKGRSVFGWGLVCFLCPLLIIAVACLPNEHLRREKAAAEERRHQETLAALRGKAE